MPMCFILFLKANAILSYKAKTNQQLIMKMISTHKQTFFIFVFIAVSVFVFSTCINNKEEKKANFAVKENPTKTISYNQFAGSQVCGDCHKNISSSYEHTAHFITSQTANKIAIKGSFAKGKNDFIYSSDRVVFLEQKEDAFYQVYYYKGEERVRRRFDIAVGSGTKGQTYLSWVNHQLIELPVSYFTQVQQWANSPGYPLYPTLFNRPATTRCLECHSTFATTITAAFQEPEKFDSTKMILGITCERCHGAAAAHVAYQKQHPEDTIGKFIINPAKFTVKQNLDFCSLCHAGRLQKTKPSFSFTAGDTLSDYFVVDTLHSSTNNIDVHGNQYGLLAQSKCFRRSKTMTCGTCHDVHNNERGKTVLFSQRCQTCHTQQHKSIEGLSNNQLIKNCIDCHMPVQASQSISFLLQGETIPTHAMMRTHFITVYDDATKEFIQKLKAINKKS